MKNFWAGLLVLGLAAAGFAAETPKDKPMDPAMMKAMELGTPGAAHKNLEPLVGHWTFTVNHWMNPGDKPESSKGTAVNTWVFGGRFVKQEVKGDMGGMPFEGLGYVGHDNLKGVYQSLWMDSMTTAITLTEGKWEGAKKTIRSEGTYSCPMTGQKDRWIRADWKVVNNDQNTYMAYSKSAGGEEFKSMEIVYKRIK